MATMFESSLSASAMRPPFSSVDTPSMADSLPSINFGFEELRDRMAKFTVKFDDFVEKGRKRVLEERNHFRINVAELHEDQRMKKRDIEILALKSTTHSQILQKEAQETSEMHSAVASITKQRDSRAADRERLRQQIAEVQKTINQRLDAQRQHAQQLDNQARFNAPELDFWQDYLCLRIEGAGIDDHLKFYFTHVDEREWGKEVWFELGMWSREYEVLQCKPNIAKEKVERMVERFNENRDLGLFLKGMRDLFVAILK